MGYLVLRADAPDGEYRPVAVGEPLVQAVPHPPFTDTAAPPGRRVWYRVSPVATVDDRTQPLSDPVAATPLPEGEGRCG